MPRCGVVKLGDVAKHGFNLSPDYWIGNKGARDNEAARKNKTLADAKAAVDEMNARHALEQARLEKLQEEGTVAILKEGVPEIPREC